MYPFKQLLLFDSFWLVGFFSVLIFLIYLYLQKITKSNEFLPNFFPYT